MRLIGPAFNRLAPLLLRWLPDEPYLRLQYLVQRGRWLHLDPPETWSEKIQWLNLHYREPLMALCADKFLVRDHVRDRGLGDNLVPLLGVYDRLEEIDYGDLPARFVLKATHGSGWNVFCRSRSVFDPRAANAQLARFLRSNYYHRARERIYKDIKPRIICEELLQDRSGASPTDYKFFCFHGEPKFIQVDYDRFTAHTRNFYDLAWRRIPCRLRYLNNPAADGLRPERLLQMIVLAQRLASDFPFVRVDLYETDNGLFFGELTFLPSRGLGKFVPSRFDRLFGEHLDLSGLLAPSSYRH